MFSLDFIALDYTDPGNNQYEYLLDGFDDTWIYLENSRVITFTNIPGGDYTLRIRASNSEGYLNAEEAEIDIRIKPPFWQYFWFRVLATVFILGFFITFYFIRIHRIQQQKIKLESLVKERTREIESKNEQLEENKTVLEDQSEELRVINTRLLKQKSELQKLNTEVQMANQAKLKFFTNISHELRTPLSLIMGPIDNILSNEKLSAYLKDQLGMMQRNTSRLLKLINQLLDFRKLETEHMKLAVAEGNIILFLKEIYSLFSNVAYQKNIQYEFISPIDELSAWYDADKIEKIISNLLSNAFKYTPEGGKIAISLSLEGDSDESDSKLQITVSDNGIGISKNEVEQIFERYYSAAESNNKDVISAGIGLALSKMLVELHKGSISVNSKLASNDDNASGSEFTIRLPLDKKNYSKDEIFKIDHSTEATIELNKDFLADMMVSEDGEINEHSATPPNDQKPAILIVEDNDEMQEFISGILKKDFRTQSANNGEEALDILDNKGFSLIISDLMMPEMDGIEFCGKVKESLNTSHIPVILLTAKTDIESQISGLKTGADDYITKPFNSRILFEKIKNLILLREKLWDRFNNQVVFNPQELTPNSLDIKLLNRIKEVVETNISNPDLDVSLFAQEVGMSKSILYEKLKILTGKTINDFISSIRLKKAAELILAGDLNLSEISMEVGYLDPNYFSKSFKKHFGVVPSKFNSESAFVN